MVRLNNASYFFVKYANIFTYTDEDETVETSSFILKLLAIKIINIVSLTSQYSITVSLFFISLIFSRVRKKRNINRCIP